MSDSPLPHSRVNKKVKKKYHLKLILVSTRIFYYYKTIVLQMIDIHGSYNQIQIF